jgi:hypothetical protein
MAYFALSGIAPGAGGHMNYLTFILTWGAILGAVWALYRIGCAVVWHWRYRNLD